MQWDPVSFQFSGYTAIWSQKIDIISGADQANYKGHTIQRVARLWPLTALVVKKMAKVQKFYLGAFVFNR